LAFIAAQAIAQSTLSAAALFTLVSPRDRQGTAGKGLPRTVSEPASRSELRAARVSPPRERLVKTLLQILVSAVLSVVFQRLLFAYWTLNDGERQTHSSDAWVFGVIAGVVLGTFFVRGLLSFLAQYW